MKGKWVRKKKAGLKPGDLYLFRTGGQAPALEPGRVVWLAITDHEGGMLRLAVRVESEGRLFPDKSTGEGDPGPDLWIWRWTK